jgi:hypothetical protein
VSVSRASWLPLAVLLAVGVAFGTRALGVAPLAFDDHPGQLARLWHVIREGPAPWAWNDGWWAGYPEMQFYPPGWFYAGATLSALSLGAVPVPAIYHVLLWITFLAPGVTVFVLLRRLLGDGWAALPGAFVALTLTGDPAGGMASAVEGGVHIGMVGARLAWALLPLLALSLARWRETGAHVPRSAALLVAAIVLTHPTHTPAALAILTAAALAAPVRRRSLVSALLGLLTGMGLTAFWWLPLVVRLEETRALAWGTLAMSSTAATFLAALAGLALLARRGGGAHERSASWLLQAVWLAALAVAVDALVVEPLGLRVLPADRVADGAWMTLLMASGLGAGAVAQAFERRLSRPIAAVTVCAGLIVFSLPGGTLALWPRAADWPSLPSVSHGVRLENLWSTLRAAPPGRVLFVRSGVPLVFGTAWYRPHTHVTALTPVLAGRTILGGTFTHPSPIAALVYRGDTRREPITQLAEQLDGESLFGRRLDRLDAATFDRYARTFDVTTVVALEDDAGRLPFVADHPGYRRIAVPPFLVFVAERPPARTTAGHAQTIEVSAAPGTWVSARLAYYPLWRAERDGRALATRRGGLGDLEIQADGRSGVVRLVYGPGLVEILAVVLSVVTLATLVIGAAMRGRGARSAPGELDVGADAQRRAHAAGRVEDPHLHR